MRTCFLISIIFFCLLFKTSAQNRAALLSAFGQYYTCGKIDVSGTKLTIEALIKLSGSGIYDRGNPTYDDIVSKHNNPSDVNYLLRPDHCEITTSNGYYATKSGYQAFSRDSYYHVAMTYDGALLKFYVNGCLYDEVNATGNLFINNYLTTIGQLAASPTTTGYEQCYGYIDEVRIWSVVRSENDIKFNMLDLPNPTTQTGLLAYYKFEGNAKNVQGNNAYDAVPINGPTLQPQAGFAAVKPFSSSTSFQQPGCNGGDGRIVINAIGGKRPYHYSLDGINFRDSYTYDALGAGKYTVYVKTDGIGCSKMEEVTLINNTLKTNVDVNNIKCFGGSDGKIKLTGPDNRITYEYNFNKSGFQANNSFENLKSGIYSISIKNNNGCVKDTSITLTQPAALKVDALIKPDTCLNKKGAINLLVSGGTKPYIYEWKEGANQPSIMNLAPGNYSVNISDKYGCSLTKEFPVENYTPRFVVGVSPEIKTICSGDTVLLKASGGNAYIWSANNSMLNSLTATNIVFPTVTTHYKVLIKNEVCNMVDSAFSTITVNPIPKVDITKSNDIDCSNGKAQILVSGGSNYEWQYSNTLSDTHSANPTATPLQTTTYFVKVSSDNGCSLNDSIRINVLSKPDYEFNLPSAFTPNYDGKNDCFRVKDWGTIKEFSMYIFDRWGQKVFSSTNASNCWDGTFKGVNQPTGVYVYIIKANTLCGAVNKKGTVTLIR